MCTSCTESKKVFSVQITTAETVSNNMDLYKEIACRLFREKVISHINVGNNRTYVENSQNIFAFDLRLTNVHDIGKVTLENIESALDGVLLSFKGYEELKVALS